jgi:hypothetical protein
MSGVLQGCVGGCFWGGCSVKVERKIHLATHIFENCVFVSARCRVHFRIFLACLGGSMISIDSRVQFLRRIPLLKFFVLIWYIYIYIYICSICICYSHISCSKSSAPHSASASARLMALRRLVAWRALDFEQELCSICICVSQEKVEIHVIFTFSINSNE